MKIDLNIDELNKTIVNKNNNFKTITTDTEYWQLRNFILNKFYRNNNFFNKYKGNRIKNSYELEKNIEKDMYAKVGEEVANKIKICALVIGLKVKIFIFQKSNNLNKKDSLIFDFDITL